MNQPNKTNAAENKGGCFPLIFLLIGYGLIAVSLLSVVNTAFGWNLELSVYGSETKVPDNWETTIALSILAVIWTLVGLFINSKGFSRFWRKSVLNKIIFLGTVVAVLVGGFLYLDNLDQQIKDRNRAEFEADSTARADDPIVEKEPERVNPYASREVGIVMTNPSLDTLKAYVEGEILLTASPREFGKAELAPGTYQIVAVTGKDTLDTIELEVREGKKSDKNLIMVINPDAFFNIAVLNYQDYYGDDNQKRKEAKTINYLLEDYVQNEELFEINVNGAGILLPRRASIDISYGTALKFVAVPNELGDDRSRAFDYAIWSFIEDEKRGIMQDGLDFFMLSDEKKREVVKNRLSDDFKKFEAEIPVN